MLKLAKVFVTVVLPFRQTNIKILNLLLAKFFIFARLGQTIEKIAKYKH